MKKYIIGITIAIMALVVACVKDLEYSKTELVGKVVEKSTNAPLSDVTVKVTDGVHIHASYKTKSSGTFRMEVDFDEINSNYYLLLDGSPNLPIKQEQLLGMGNRTYDYGSIILYDKNDTNLLPKVTTGNISNVQLNSITVEGCVISDYPLTERGVCYATHQSPTISDMKKTAGISMGSFSCDLTGLQVNTTYYVRAYATNNFGTSYGAQNSQTTLGLPSVTTTEVTMNGTTVVTGGNVTSDGGFPVTARGICYGIYPYPDLSSSYTHTSNGNGTGYFTSTINNASGKIYIRAYATNANGTAYGNQIELDIDYMSLPTFAFNGHTYRVAPDPHTSAEQYILWTSANSYCDNLTLYDYSDWRMPTVEELETMYANRQIIGGFINDADFGNINYRSFYHSSTSHNGYHYVIKWGNGARDWSSDFDAYGFRSYSYVRECVHVRPIRVEN